MPEDRKVTRKLSAILSADVKGYSLLMADDEVHTIETLKAHRRIIADLIAEHSGRVVDSPGDNILAEFRSAVDAVECAARIQGKLAKENARFVEEKKVQFRIGVNVGDVIQDGERIYGNGVNVAARIEGLAEPGGICISRNAYDHISDKLNYGYAYLGEHTVKNIKKPVRVYRLLIAPEDAGKLIGDVPKPVAENWIWATIVVAAAVIAVIATLVYQNVSKPDFEPAKVEAMAYPLPDKPSIAVLPFDNLSGDPSQEYFSDGISENIITALSKIGELFVIARNSSFTYKGKPVNVQQIGRELGVKYVLEGSVRRSGDKVRITAQLIDAASGNHVWAENYDRSFDDLFAIQDEITLKIINGLQIHLTEGEYARIWARQNCSIDVYLKGMEARSIWAKGTKEAVIRFGQIGQEMVETEPECLMGYSILVWYNIALAKYLISPQESVEKALKYAQKAFSMDDSNPSILSALGNVYLEKREYEKAIEMGERAVTIAPNGAMTHAMLGLILSYAGKPDQGISHMHQALRLDPFPPAWYYSTLGRCYLVKKQYEKSLEAYTKALQLSPDDVMTLIGLTAVYSLLGRDEDAHREVKRLLELVPGYNVAYINFAPFKNQEDANLLIDALLKAGLPDKRRTASPDSRQEKEAQAATVNSSNAAIDLIGEWDTVYDLKEYGVYNDVVQITQTGNTFVGIKLVGTQFSPRGSETIKGGVEDNRIKSMLLKTTQGWMPAEWRVNEQGDEIFLKVSMESIGLTVDVKLTRK